MYCDHIHHSPTLSSLSSSHCLTTAEQLFPTSSPTLMVLLLCFLFACLLASLHVTCWVCLGLSSWAWGRGYLPEHRYFTCWRNFCLVLPQQPWVISSSSGRGGPLRHSPSRTGNHSSCEFMCATVRKKMSSSSSSYFLSTLSSTVFPKLGGGDVDVSFKAENSAGFD